MTDKEKLDRMIHCTHRLIDMVEKYADMEDHEVREALTKALSELGENPADAD